MLHTSIATASDYNQAFIIDLYLISYFVGKTSLCNVLYRLYPLTSGNIEIGEINTACIGLYQLRRAMAVIPQDPMLFAGTIRFNIDPNHEFTDDQIWFALEKTYLKEMVWISRRLFFFH